MKANSFAQYCTSSLSDSQSEKTEEDVYIYIRLKGRVLISANIYR